MGSKIEDLHQTHDKIFKGFAYLQAPFLLAIRIYWGWLFFQAGSGKFAHFPATVDYFAQIHMPIATISAFFTASAEYLGGLCLIFGLAARPAALALTITTSAMLYKIYRHEIMHGLIHQTEPCSFLLIVLTVLLFGPGKLSIDHAVGWAFSAFSSPPVAKPGGGKGGH